MFPDGTSLFEKPFEITINPEHIRKLHRDGVSNHKIAEQCGCSRSSVIRILKRWERLGDIATMDDWDHRYPRGTLNEIENKDNHKRKLTDDQITTIKSLMATNDFGVRKVAAYFGVSTSTIRYHTDENFKRKMREKEQMKTKAIMDDPFRLSK